MRLGGRDNMPRPLLTVGQRVRKFKEVSNFEIGSRTPGHANLGANLWSRGKNCPRPMCVPNLKIVALPVCEILRGSQNFEIGSPGHANLGVNLWSGATAYVRAKFEDRSFFCLRNIEGVPKLRNWVTSPGHAQFRANLWSGGKNCPRPMCLPDLMIVVFSVCEILRGSQNFEIGSRTPGHAHLGANL